MSTAYWNDLYCDDVWRMLIMFANHNCKSDLNSCKWNETNTLAARLFFKTVATQTWSSCGKSSPHPPLWRIVFWMYRWINWVGCDINPVNNKHILNDLMRWCDVCWHICWSELLIRFKFLQVKLVDRSRFASREFVPRVRLATPVSRCKTVTTQNWSTCGKSLAHILSVTYR